MDCTKSDLDSNFYSPTDLMYERLEDAFCIKNPEEVKLQGNFNAENMKVLNFMVSRCSGDETVCKTEEEIDRFMDSNLYLWTYSNDQKYSP